MSWLIDTIACGALSGIIWAGLVWMSPETPIEQPLGWWQGIGAIAISNMVIWLGLASFKPHLVVWVAVLLGGNAVVGKFILPYCRQVRIPIIWAVIVHPVAITAFNILLGGALGKVS
jgi:hypothetical protein